MVETALRLGSEGGIGRGGAVEFGEAGRGSGLAGGASEQRSGRRGRRTWAATGARVEEGGERGRELGTCLLAATGDAGASKGGSAFYKRRMELGGGTLLASACARRGCAHVSEPRGQ